MFEQKVFSVEISLAKNIDRVGHVYMTMLKPRISEVAHKARRAFTGGYYHYEMQWHTQFVPIKNINCINR